MQSCFTGITASAESHINILVEPDLELPVGDMKAIDGVEYIYGDEPYVYFDELGVASEPYAFYNYGSDYGRKYLAEESQELLECYDDLLEQCKAFEGVYSDIMESSVNGKPMFFVPKLNNKEYSLTIDEIGAVIITLINDHPELYWIETFVYSFHSIEGPYTISLTINEDYASGFRRQELDEAIQRNLEEYISIAECFRSQGDHITVKAVHDAIINSVDYAYEYIKKDNEIYRTPSTAASAHNIVSVLDDDDKTMPVCEGYTETFQLILNALGINNVHVTGNGLTNFGIEPHAWNLVKLDDGNYYFIDVTWDDQGENGTFYNYFARGWGNFSDHVINTPDNNEGDFLYKLPYIPESDFELIRYIDKSLINDVEISASGACGEKMTWKLYKNGLLYISGTGDMYDFGFDYDQQVSKAPWCKYAAEINYVLTEKGIRNISSYAFWKCSTIISVYFSEGPDSIGSYVFGNCWNLNTVRIPSSINKFKTNALNFCKSITDIYYGGSEEEWQTLDKRDAFIPDDVIMHYNFSDTTPITEYQYTINDLKITAGRAEVELAADNNAAEAYLILAAYDKGVFKFLLKKKAEDGKIIFDDDIIDASLKYKAVVWDNINGQKPLAEFK